MSLDYLPWRRPESYADRLCVRDADTDLSYADFGARVDAGAEQLAAERGVTTGDVVAVMLPNPVVLTAGEATHQLMESRAVLVVASDPSRTGDTPVLAVDDPHTIPAGTMPPPSAPERGLALLIYTSGSTAQGRWGPANPARSDRHCPAGASPDGRGRHPAAPGEPGEVVIQGDIAMQGYPNLYPNEIEAAVVGAPDEVYGEVKVPVAIHPVEAVPRNAVGNIDKTSLRRQASTLVTHGA